MAWAVETHSNASLQVFVPYAVVKVFVDAAARVPPQPWVGIQVKGSTVCAVACPPLAGGRGVEWHE